MSSHITALGAAPGNSPDATERVYPDHRNDVPLYAGRFSFRRAVVGLAMRVIKWQRIRAEEQNGGSLPGQRWSDASERQLVDELVGVHRRSFRP